jgi:hypothetical protein
MKIAYFKIFVLLFPDVYSTGKVLGMTGVNKFQDDTEECSIWIKKVWT